MPANKVVPTMNQLTGILSRIGIILVILYFAFFSNALQVVAAETAATQVEYALPYPGLLPDSPVYFVKVIRDSVVLWFISDPVKKSFYTLLLSDKRIASGQVLVNSGKVAIGVTSLLKGEEYFSQAVDLAAKKRDENLLAKLTVAGAKHSEVLLSLSSKVPGDSVSTYEKANQNNTQSRKRIMELLLQK